MYIQCSETDKIYLKYLDVSNDRMFSYKLSTYTGQTCSCLTFNVFAGIFFEHVDKTVLNTFNFIFIATFVRVESINRCITLCDVV